MTNQAAQTKAATRPEPTRLQLIREDLARGDALIPPPADVLRRCSRIPGCTPSFGTLANWLWINDHRFWARLLSWFARFLTNDIHPGAAIGRRHRPWRRVVWARPQSSATT
jgi:serine O-acetyltransferase